MRIHETLGVISNFFTKTLYAGYPTAVDGIGNSGTGTVTPDFKKPWLKTMTINGSFTLGEPAQEGACSIICTNDGTGGYTITTTGYEVIGPGTYDNTASVKQRLNIFKEGSNSYLEWSAIA